MTLLPITFIFADGAARTIELAPGESVIDAAKAAGYSLMCDCREGRCGTCEAEVLSGGVDLDAYDEMTLVPEDRQAGVILSCVARAREAAVIQFPYDFAEVTAAADTVFPGRIGAIEAVAADTLRLAVDIEQPLDFLPGQYVNIGPAGAGYSRCYSMANPSGSSRLIFYTRVLADGKFSQWLSREAKPGDAIEISAPKGAFFLREETRPRLFIAGGTGLAPFLSMLAGLAEQPAGGRLPTHFLIGARTSEHLFALEEVNRLLEAMPDLRVSVAVEDASGSGFSAGRVTDLLHGLPIDPATRVYLCGPPPMVEAGRQAALSAGIARRDILCERFS